jgi:hypothetical protein
MDIQKGKQHAPTCTHRKTGGRTDRQAVGPAATEGHVRFKCTKGTHS